MYMYIYICIYICLYKAPEYEVATCLEPQGKAPRLARPQKKTQISTPDTRHSKDLSRTACSHELPRSGIAMLLPNPTWLEGAKEPKRGKCRVSVLGIAILVSGGYLIFEYLDP